MQNYLSLYGKRHALATGILHQTLLLASVSVTGSERARETATMTTFTFITVHLPGLGSDQSQRYDCIHLQGANQIFVCIGTSDKAV